MMERIFIKHGWVFQSMKKIIPLFVCLTFLIGCTPPQPAKPTTTPLPVVTEVACPGVEPRGLGVGMQAYVDLNGPVTKVDLRTAPDSTDAVTSIPHHLRVTLQKGPECASESAWWHVTLPDGKSGWIQVGAKLNSDSNVFSSALLPFRDDAVQRDVPDDRKQEAQIRYITADIELGGADVLKYYEDQVAARPDDPETALMKTALNILKENGGKAVANLSAFERKPLRGGTSVVDAGTEYVQPGLDILLTPCDRPDPIPACQNMFK